MCNMWAFNHKIVVWWNSDSFMINQETVKSKTGKEIQIFQDCNSSPQVRY